VTSSKSTLVIGYDHTIKPEEMATLQEIDQEKAE
jgi:hypothetical protein